MAILLSPSEAVRAIFTAHGYSMSFYPFVIIGLQAAISSSFFLMAMYRKQTGANARTNRTYVCVATIYSSLSYKVKLSQIIRFFLLKI